MVQNIEEQRKYWVSQVAAIKNLTCAFGFFALSQSFWVMSLPSRVLCFGQSYRWACFYQSHYFVAGSFGVAILLEGEPPPSSQVFCSR